MSAAANQLRKQFESQLVVWLVGSHLSHEIELGAIAKGIELPVRYIGTGEQADDFSLFDAASFAEGLFSLDDDAASEG